MKFLSSRPLDFLFKAHGCCGPFDLVPGHKGNIVWLTETCSQSVCILEQDIKELYVKKKSSTKDSFNIVVRLIASDLGEIHVVFSSFFSPRSLLLGLSHHRSRLLGLKVLSIFQEFEINSSLIQILQESLIRFLEHSNVFKVSRLQLVF